MARTFGSDAWARSLADLLAEGAGDFDAVLIDSVGSPHHEVVREAAAAGKHVLVETPLAPSTEGADAAIAACREAGVRLMVGQASRFVPSNRTVKASLESGNLGAPGMLRIHRWEPLAAGIRPLPGPVAAGGGAGGRVARDLDMAAWMFETLPTEVYALARKLSNPGMDVYDYVQVHLGFPEGGMCLIDHSMALPRGEDYFALSVIGSTGAAYADDHHNAHLLYRGGDPVALKAGQGRTHLLAQLEEFVAAVREGREPAVTGQDGRATVQIAEAVTGSVESGRAARLVGDVYEFL
jgi:myo-inositol 2-dehydrogenase/D-chiro-inositol 1-dehydrogenase